MPAAKPKPAADLAGLTGLIDSMRSNSLKMAERIEKLEATVLATVGGAELLERRRACQDWQARKTREIERIGTELKRVTLIVPDLSVLSDEVGSKLTALEASASGEISRGAEALAGRTGRLEPEVKAKAASDEVKRLKAEAALLATHEDVEPLRDLAIGGFKEGVAKRIDDLTERSHRDREELEGQVGALALLLEGIGSALEASGASLDAKASEARQFVHRAEKEVAGKVEASELGELRGAYAAFLSDFRELLQSQLAEVRERTATTMQQVDLVRNQQDVLAFKSDVDPLRERAEQMARRLDETSEAVARKAEATETEAAVRALGVRFGEDKDALETKAERTHTEVRHDNAPAQRTSLPMPHTARMTSLDRRATSRARPRRGSSSQSSRRAPTSSRSRARASPTASSSSVP